MKNNPNPGHAPANPALIQAHSSVYNALSDVRLVAKILRQHCNRRPAPIDPQRFLRTENILRGMLYDVQRLIGCETIRNFSKSVRHE